MAQEFFHVGRMISSSKKAKPGHVAVFNANIFAKSKGKLWFGDLDLTDDQEALARYAASVGEDIYILREYDGRFDREANPAWENAVARISPDGSIHMAEPT